MKYAIIIFLFLFATHMALGQNIITGNVTNTSGVPINSANVVLTKKNENVIIAFAITDSKGNFKISYNLAADSITVKVIALGYADKLIPIANATQQLKFALEEKTTQLPTVLVRSKPISENGDTTNYNVQSFTGKQDRVIGDVIAKLPGIEMSPNGQITFNGKPISHYYIDGLDMLGNKYNIANQNIPADLVDKVQLLKNHQDIKLLDSLNTSTDPALNLKLKKKAHNKLIGIVQLGVGTAPLLWSNAITGLNFNSGLQLITSFKNNNTGASLASEVAGINVSVSRVGDKSEKNIKENVINTLDASVPGISQKRYLFNNTNLFHFNILKVLHNKAQLKTNLSFINDYTINESTVQSTYSFPGSAPINFTEKTNGAINSNKVEGAFTYTLNNKKVYLKNTATLKLDIVNQQAALINGSPIAQYLNNPYYLYTN
ncbi:MAG: carboxypeptidase-like regulatory domain-containing protein, partial [Ferruginibacter sp.]